MFYKIVLWIFTKNVLNSTTTATFTIDFGSGLNQIKVDYFLLKTYLPLLFASMNHYNILKQFNREY